MRVNKFKNTIRTATLAGFAVLYTFGAAQTAPTLHFYSLGTTQLNIDRVTSIANNFKFTQLRGVTGAPLPIWGMGDGSVRQVFANGELQILPDLRTETTNGPSATVAQRYSTDFIKQFGLFPDDVSQWALGETFAWSRLSGDPKGGTQGGSAPIRGFRYQRMLDGLPVYGKNSIIGTTVDSHGLIGLLFNVRPVAMLQTPVLAKTPDQMDGEYQMKLNNLLAQTPGKVNLVSKTPCYLDQGVRFVQPAYRYRIEITDTMGGVQGEELFIPSAVNAPETIFNEHFAGFDPIIARKSPAPTALPATTNVRLGEYVVRQDADQDICLSIANDYYNNARANAALTGFAVTRTQYYWDVQWLWMAALGIGDNSRWYPGAVDFAVVIAHGQPWGFSSLSNYGEWVDLHNMDHYGQASGTTNPSHDYTSYMLFTACSMMPAPGDPYGGYYTSGGPFDVYWNIFWGMHGMYGFRTTAGKNSCDTAFSQFGGLGALHVPLTSAWMNVTSGLDHSNNWNYGTAVLPSGREADTMFDTQALAPASSLTMWWNHP